MSGLEFSSQGFKLSKHALSDSLLPESRDLVLSLTSFEILWHIKRLLNAAYLRQADSILIPPANRDTDAFLLLIEAVEKTSLCKRGIEPISHHVVMSTLLNIVLIQLNCRVTLDLSHFLNSLIFDFSSVRLSLTRTVSFVRFSSWCVFQSLSFSLCPVTLIFQLFDIDDNPTDLPAEYSVPYRPFLICLLAIAQIRTTFVKENRHETDSYEH